jgi:hypothetical protein
MTSIDFEIPKEMFHSPDYQGVDSFLQACRQRGIPLEKVGADLVRYLALLDSQLVGLINKDYADFVELSASILGTDVLIESVKNSLSKVQAELESVKQSVESRTSVMQDRQNQIRAAEEEKRTLEKFVRISDSLDDVEGLLRIGEDKGVDVNLLRNGSLIDRVVTQFTELNFNASQLKESQFVQSLRPRISRLELGIENALKELFLEALAPKVNGSSQELLTRCLRTYSAINRAAVPQEIFRNVVVQPLIAEIVTVANLEGGNRTSCDGLRGIFQSILECVEKSVLPIVPQTLALLIHSTFDEVIDQLIKKIGSQVFATGIPETFHRNLLVSKDFIAQWESRILGKGDEREVEVFRAGESLKRWNRGWKIEVYYTLRSQEIIRTVEAGLGEVALVAQGEAAASKKFVVKGFEVLYDCLEKIWARDIFLPGLEANFLRLCFQIVSRARTWILVGLGELETPNVSSPWKKAGVVEWTAAHSDCVSLTAAFSSRLATRIALALQVSSLPQPVNKALEVAGSEIENQVSQKIEAHLVKVVGAECCASLQFVRRISSFCFRADSTNPEVSMPEVENILTPLQNLTKKCPWVGGSVMEGWSALIGKQILESYKEVTREVLVQAHATQKFILQRSKGEGASNNSIEKIIMQFKLDLARLQALFEQQSIQLPELFKELLTEIEENNKKPTTTM